MFKDYFENLKLRYSIMFCYGSKKFKYIFLKTLCIFIFTIPFFIHNIIELVFITLCWGPSFIPLIGILFRFFLLILSTVSKLIFEGVVLADLFFESKNTEYIDKVIKKSEA